MKRAVDPARRCLAVADWPEADRRIWETAVDPRAWGRVMRRGPAAHLKPVTLGKCAEGYGRWLGFLAYSGLLDPTEAPEQRVTDARIMAYLDLLLDNSNAGHTIYGRLCDLKNALRILAPAADFGWLLRPGGVDIRGRLDMTPRHLTVHHPRTIYRWGLELMETALTLTGPRRRQVMLRDGLMIALFAARAMRKRSQHALSLETQVRRVEGRWWVVLGPDDVKTGRPIEYPVPGSLQSWIERYVTVERIELLAGNASDALWINWGGKPLGERGIEKRIRWHSAKKFGPEGGFGPHRFRYCIASVAPVEDPAAPVSGAALLGISAEVYREHYDRGGREVAARRFVNSLEAERRETEGYAHSIFEQRRQGDLSERAEPAEERA
jgi:hypothetical protein